MSQYDDYEFDQVTELKIYTLQGTLITQYMCHPTDTIRQLEAFVTTRRGHYLELHRISDRCGGMWKLSDPSWKQDVVTLFGLQPPATTLQQALQTAPPLGFHGITYVRPTPPAPTGTNLSEYQLTQDITLFGVDTQTGINQFSDNYPKGTTLEYIRRNVFAGSPGYQIHSGVGIRSFTNAEFFSSTLSTEMVIAGLAAHVGVSVPGFNRQVNVPDTYSINVRAPKPRCAYHSHIPINYSFTGVKWACKVCDADLTDEFVQSLKGSQRA